MEKQLSAEENVMLERMPPLDAAKSKQDSKIRAARWKGLAMFLKALNVLFLFVVLIIAIVWNIEHGRSYPVNKDQIYCIDCSKVNEKGKYDMKDDSSDKQCCGSADMIMKDLVYKNRDFTRDQTMSTTNDVFPELFVLGYGKKVKENYEEEELKDRFFYSHMHCEEDKDKSETRPATRIVGLLHQTEKNSNELQWGENDKLTFRHADIEYRNGKLVPKHRGTYFLYSQITVNLNRTSTSPIYHTVYRWRSRNQNMEQLLEGAMSNCQLSVNSSDSTSYLGATFMLEANDEISVKITHTAIVKYESYAGNYFGMHKI